MVFYGPIATLYRQARGVSVFQITLIESISLACLIALEIPWGYVADRIGYRRTLAACNVLYFLSKIVFWRAEGFGGFLLERLMLSAVLSGLSGCDSAYLFSLAGEGESQKAFGAYEASATAGLVAASLLFSTAVGGDFDAAGFLTVLSYGAAMVLTFFLPEVPPPARRSAGFGTRAGEAAREVWDNRRFLLFLAAAALLTESNQTITVFLSQLQYVRAGVPARAMGYLFIPLTLMGLFAARSHRLTARLGEGRALSGLFLLGALSCGLLAVTGSPVLSVAGILALRLSASVFAPIGMEVQNRQVRSCGRATMLSVYSSVMNLVAVGTGLIFGRLAEEGVGRAMAAGAGFCLAGLLLYTLWRRLPERTAG
ncbi:MFS transporter [Anaerotruncus massiliensis (ex Liu et al. 2021)]|uniref:MFS transporter n=3 Tax=Oscillospiraceae TaxID=216572 RepID=A0A498D1S4_9FIRM|nr:MFS transporter [Anaerotruncus massiliensis (ex Togo et al. 2019)]RLL12180.1 MFS transporter [Anaerotruncus massiliensis (ex Liu et al. 2021)]